jgi:coproporphyrinogen III oxidase-like Fe-S oxidoreductase
MNMQLDPIPFESFTYPFFEFSYRADHPRLVDAFLNPGELPKNSGRKGLYVHIPFCTSICRFCPFVKGVGTRERIDAYVAALEAELLLIGETRRVASWVFDSVYIGGGTPSILEIAHIERLFQAIRRHLHLDPQCEISFELEAKTASREKLLCLRQLGVSRVSFGAQTFDERIRPFLNLTATPEEVANTIALFTELFPGSNNMDMIVGLPGQSEEAMYQDLEQAVASGIASMSIYPMDYVMTLPSFLEQIRQGAIPAPADPQTRNAMFYNARKFLGRSYSEDNIYSYGRPGSTPSTYMFSTVYGGYSDEYVGVGCSAYSYLRGLMYQNVLSEADYVERLRQGRSPVRVASPYHAFEKGLVFFPKRMSFDFGELGRLDLLEIYEGRIQALIEGGLVRLDDQTLRLTPLGEKHYAALMVQFFSESQRRLYRKITQRLKAQIGWDEGVGALSQKPIARGYGGLTAMAGSKSAGQ